MNFQIKFFVTKALCPFYSLTDTYIYIYQKIARHILTSHIPGICGSLLYYIFPIGISKLYRPEVAQLIC